MLHQHYNGHLYLGYRSIEVEIFHSKITGSLQLNIQMHKYMLCNSHCGVFPSPVSSASCTKEALSKFQASLESTINPVPGV